MANRIIEWTGTATDLLEKLKALVPDDTWKLKTWPKAANSLGRRLRRAATFLRTAGVEIILPGSDSWRRDIIIRKSLQNIVESVEIAETSDGGGSTVNDSINDTSHDIVDAQNIVEIPLADKSAPDKAFHDINGFNDKKSTLSKSHYGTQESDDFDEGAL